MLADSSQHYESESANDAKAASSLYLAAISSLNWYESVWRNGSVLDFGSRGSGIETQLGLMERVLFFFCFCFAPSRVRLCAQCSVHTVSTYLAAETVLLPLQPVCNSYLRGWHSRTRTSIRTKGKGREETCVGLSYRAGSSEGGATLRDYCGMLADSPAYTLEQPVHSTSAMHTVARHEHKG